MAAPRKMLIDCDPGTDDAQAILMALSRDDVEIVGICTVTGNVPARQCARNVLQTLRVADRKEIPVFCGSMVSLRGDEMHSMYHGKDGLGDVLDPGLVDMNDIQSERAANAIVRLVNQHKGEITLVAMGPLTNIAVALQLDPELGRKFQRIIFMGGNTTGAGNITRAGEFNVYVDPDAARMVLKRINAPILLVSFELCLKYTISWDRYNALIKQPGPIPQFVKEIDEKKLAIPEYSTYPAFDQLAMAIALEPDLVKETKQVYATVCTDQGVCRGQVVIDWRCQSKKPPNVTLVTMIDGDSYNQLYSDLLSK